MSLSGRNFASASVPSGTPDAGRLELRRQLAPGPQVSAVGPEHALEQAVELGHRRADAARPRWRRNRTPAPPRCRPAWSRTASSPAPPPAPAYASGTAGNSSGRTARRAAVERGHIGLDRARTRRRLARGDRRAPGRRAAPSISMPVTRPCGPTRSAISRITAPGPEPTSRQLMPGLRPIRSSTSSVARCHIRAWSRRR